MYEINNAKLRKSIWTKINTTIIATKSEKSMHTLLHNLRNNKFQLNISKSIYQNRFSKNNFHKIIRKLVTLLYLVLKNNM